MITRREAIRLFGSASAAAFAAQLGFSSLATNALAEPALIQQKSDDTPSLAPGSPLSPERTALIESFKKQSDGLEKRFEARTYKSDWTMPYRLFKPEAKGKLPLVVYLHGSGGLGDGNSKQLALGNTFGTRLWLLPENQKAHP